VRNVVTTIEREVVLERKPTDADIRRSDVPRVLAVSVRDELGQLLIDDDWAKDEAGDLTCSSPYSAISELSCTLRRAHLVM
jgi:hypothetical protein